MRTTQTTSHRNRFTLRYDRRLGLLLISPWLVGFLLFKFLPILASLGISLTNFHMLRPEETQFIGLANYARLFQDRAAWVQLFNTLALALFNVPFQLAASVALALLLNSRRLKGRTLLRTLFFLPSIIPSVAIALMWMGFMNPTTGWLTRLVLEPLGLGGFDSLYSQGAIALLFLISSLWSVGPGMLVILGALQGVSPEVQEAARVDGAGPLVRLFYITLPLLSPALFFTLIINLITVFGGVILLDRGNVFSGSSSPFDGYIYQTMFTQRQFGYAASLSWLFFVVIMALVVYLFSTANRWVYYPERDV